MEEVINLASQYTDVAAILFNPPKLWEEEIIT